MNRRSDRNLRIAKFLSSGLVGLALVGATSVASADRGPSPAHLRPSALTPCTVEAHTTEETVCEACDQINQDGLLCSDMYDGSVFTYVCGDESGTEHGDDTGTVYCRPKRAEERAPGAETTEAAPRGGQVVESEASSDERAAASPSESTPAPRRSGCTSAPAETGGALALLGLVGAGVLRRRRTQPSS